MATIRELFKSQNKDIYGLSGKIFIESRGLINPPRGAALLVSSPDALADLIGNQIGGAFGGSANRPSDTIFRNNTPFAKPITLTAPTTALLRDAVKGGKTAYFIKQSPAPGSLIANIKQGASSPVGAIMGGARNIIDKFGAPNAFKDLKNKIKGLSSNNTYGSKFAIDANGKPKNDETIFSKSYPEYTKQDDGSYRQTSVKDRGKFKSWDVINTEILNLKAETELSSKEDVENSNVSYIKIHALGDANPTYFTATISGLQEQITPEWQNYKFVGSPFNVYTYNGVEREISFDFKLYAKDNDTKNSMLSKLNYLTKLVYPFKDLVTTTYEQSKDASQIMVAPNFIKLSIRSLYNDVFGIVSSLSFSVEDDTAWATYSNNDKKQLIPNVINVSFSMKVIETEKSLGIKTEGNKSVYNYNFRDVNPDDWKTKIQESNTIKLD